MALGSLSSSTPYIVPYIPYVLPGPEEHGGPPWFPGCPSLSPHTTGPRKRSGPEQGLTLLALTRPQGRPEATRLIVTCEKPPSRLAGGGGRGRGRAATAPPGGARAPPPNGCRDGERGRAAGAVALPHGARRGRPRGGGRRCSAARALFWSLPAAPAEAGPSSPAARCRRLNKTASVRGERRGGGGLRSSEGKKGR